MAKKTTPAEEPKVKKFKFNPDSHLSEDEQKHAFIQQQAIIEERENIKRAKAEAEEED